MPTRSLFAGFGPPDDELRWNHAQYQASEGEQVLLASLLRSVRSPLDLIKGDTSFRWVHRLSDVQLDFNHGNFTGLKHVHQFRAPIAKLGYRRFAFRNFEGDQVQWFSFNPNDVLHVLKQNPSIIPRKFVGIGLMDENWGWLSSYFLNRTARWATHLTPKNNFNLKTSEFTEDEIRPFLDDPRLLMLLVNQHHNVSSHPKVLTLPLGIMDPKLIWNTLTRVVRKNLSKNRLLFTAGSNWYVII